jgi:hypothetical protein
MNIRIRQGLVVGVVVVSSLSTVMVAAAERQDRSSGVAPQAAPEFQAGDVLTVTSDGARMMRGADLVAVAAKGQRLVVVDVRDGWIGAYMFTNGQRQAGWFRAIDVTPADDPPKPAPAQACLCAMQTVTPAPQPAQETSPVSNGPRRDYFRAYDAGYYDRHETDPNLTTWEPWMH